MAGCLNKKKAEFITLGDSDDDIDCIKSKSNYLTKHQPIETNAAKKRKLSAKKTYKTIEQTSDEDETFNEFLKQYRAPVTKESPKKIIEKPRQNELLKEAKVNQNSNQMKPKTQDTSIILISSDEELPVIRNKPFTKDREKKKVSSPSVSDSKSGHASICNSASSLDSLKGFSCINLKSNEIKFENIISIKRVETTLLKNRENSKYKSFIESLTLKLDDESERDPEVLVYINNFKDKEGRINLLNKCYALFNESVFQNKLPKDLPLFWNGKLTSSGGYCKKSVKNKKAFVEIHISVKICDNPERLRDTLIHEMCHAATFLIDKLVKDGHGPAWQRWTCCANSIYKSIPTITRCHSYQTEKKFIYRCQNCKYEFHRNRRSFDVSKYACGSCKEGRFVIVENEKLVNQKKSQKT